MIIIVMGVAGSGKTLIGRILANELEWPFYDADDFHSPDNIQKMSRVAPLSDEDRDAWLQTLAELIAELARNRRSAVLACSALKQSYREKLGRKAASVRYVYLKGSYELVHERLEARQEHFMKAGLLQNQFDILEEPRHAVIVDAGQNPERIVTRIRQELNL